MGRLVGLELNNFKSYRGTSSIGFGTSFFTSIIGPNGSGKSNMMDAISFVLGIRSNHLRSHTMRDLVYRGTIMNNERNDDSNIDESEHADPTTAYVMAVYEKSNGDILKLKRSINEAGSSEYRINNKLVNATQYADVLKQENILIKARNFLVFQGDVDKVASQSAEDLTKLIEIISGSIEYKKEYDSMAEMKDKAHDESASLNSKRRTLREEYNQYKGQCLEIEAFDSKTEEVAQLIQSKYLASLYYNDKDLNSKLKDTKKLRKQVKSLQEDINHKQAELKGISSGYSKEENETRKLEKRITNVKKQAKEKSLSLIPLTSEIDHITKKLADYNKRIKTLEEDKDDQASIIEDKESRLATLQKAYKFSDQQFKQTREKDLDPKASKEYKELRQEFLALGGHIEEKMVELDQERQTWKRKSESVKKQLVIAKTRERELSESKTAYVRQSNELDSQIADIKSNLENKKSQLYSLQTTRESLAREEFEINSAFKDVLLQLNEMNASQRETARERKLRENCASLKRLFPGVRGLVYDLCKPKQKKYDTAVSTLLGKNFDAIIVENLQVATRCIEYLKEQRLGVASFIPLDSVSSTPPPGYLRSINDKVKLALDIVDYDPTLEKAIQYVCGNSLVCDTIDIAKYVRWERKIEVKVVSLDGSLIHKSGLMTGGMTQTSNRRWDKSEIQALSAQKDQFKAELDALQAKKPSELMDKKLMDELSSLETQLEFVTDSKTKLARSIHDLDAELFGVSEEVADIMKKYKTLQEIENSFEEQTNAAKDDLKQFQHQVYSKFCKKYGFKDINEYEDKHEFKSREYAREKAEYEKEIESLQNSLSFEKERLSDYDKRLSKLNHDKAKFSNNLQDLNSKKEALQEEIDNLESEVEVLKEEFTTVDEKLKGQTSKVSELETALSEQRSELHEANAKISSCEESLEQLNMEKLNILRTCKLENVSLPFVNGSLEGLPLDNTEEYESFDANDIILDFDELKSEFKKYESFELLDQVLKVEIEELQKELSTMNPNMKARERLEEVQERLEDLDGEFSNAKSVERNLVSTFTEIKTKRYELFSEAFKHISSKIDSIYKELTKSNVSPLGGSAYLTLDDEDEPYLSGVKYHAMPPMKRFRDMELLSGGEKTIAALALLFAIHSFQPSPFFVLDEVDAALDNANVNKIANYITKHAGPGFQFIVISLKNGLFERSDALVGIYREQQLNSSKTLTIDLRNYPDEEVAQ